MKTKKKRGMNGLLASLLAATLFLSAPLALDAKRVEASELTCTGPVGEVCGEAHCLCENNNTCFDEYGCSRPEDDGFSWRDALQIVGIILAIGTYMI